MKILITGVTGQLGYDVAREATRRGHDVVGTGRADDTYCRTYVKCDITNEYDIYRLISLVRPDAVIHCAAWTNVDKAEEYPDECFQVNCIATKNIAQACAAADIKMLYVSSDYVFGGAHMASTEPHPACKFPSEGVNVYGHSKLMGELMVRHTLDKAFIVRTSWVFGYNGKNFVKTMLNLGKTRNEITVVCDQIGRPTYTVDLAKLLVNMIETDKYGTYNACNEGDNVSWFDFARKIYALSGNSQITIKPVKTEDYELAKAKRPLNSRMSTEELQHFGFEQLPNWEDALYRYLIEIGEINEVHK